MTVPSCQDKLSEKLTYDVKDGEVICTFTKDDIGESGHTDLEDFKEIAIRKFQGVDSLGEINAKGWKLVQVDSFTYQLRKNLADLGALRYEQKMLLMRHLEPGYDPYVAGDQGFGFMEHEVKHINNVGGDTYRFRLAEYNEAYQVYLAGNFNNWGTLSNPMIKTDSGWVCDLKLQAGAYLYKYVVDGQWAEDPFNANKKHNEFGGYNSQFVINNHKFELEAFEDAEEVLLAGEFTQWRDRSIPMLRTNNGWEANVYLRDGTYEYKYIVDNVWTLDPANPNQVTDIQGHVNSQLSLGTPHHFELEGFPDAQQIILSGSFNGWDESRNKMEQREGRWVYDYVLPEGNYEYKFIVDGEWITDPGNPIIVANEHGTGNSWLVVGNPEQFQLNGFPASKVYITGSFINWQEDKCLMQRKQDKWMFPVYLSKGKHSYKFIVDGLWLPDPNNEYQEMNHEGSFNSVIWKNATSDTN